MKGLAVLALLFGGVSVMAAAEEQAIARKNVPSAVRTAIGREEGRGAAIGRITVDTEHGRTTYEVETKVEGHLRALVFNAAGALIESEEQTSLAAIPPAVRAAFEAAGRVVKVERVTQGTTVIDEAEIEKAGQKTELAVDASGKRLKP